MITNRPRYLKNKPFHLVRIPWVATSGQRSCPFEYNNGLHAAVHSVLAAMKVRKDMGCALYWAKTARRQIKAAIRALQKPGARLLPMRKLSNKEMSCGE